MLKKVTKNAKNLDEALEAAAAELGVSKDEISHEIIRETGKNFFGKLLFGSEVEISAWITKDAEKLSSAKKPVKTQNVKAEPKKDDTKAEKKEAPVSAEPKKKADENKPSIAKTEPKDEIKAENTDVKSEPKNRHDEEIEIPTDAVVDAKEFLNELLAKMGIKASLYVKLGKNSIDIDVSGEKMGLLIGKRGDTLDAVQYLTSLYVNRNKERYIKINIDTENYRAKREETLVRLAHGLERRVLREKKSITLEPMSPNERRIIHAALQRNNKIKTYSIGDEPNRKVVVALNK